MQVVGLLNIVKSSLALKFDFCVDHEEIPNGKENSEHCFLVENSNRVCLKTKISFQNWIQTLLLFVLIFSAYIWLRMRTSVLQITQVIEIILTILGWLPWVTTLTLSSNCMNYHRLDWKLMWGDISDSLRKVRTKRRKPKIFFCQSKVLMTILSQ